MLIVVEKLYFCTVVYLPFDNQPIIPVLFPKKKSAKVCVLYISTA